jgi:hypothetical protein
MSVRHHHAADGEKDSGERRFSADLASQPSMTFGPYAVPALVADGLCIDLDAASGYRWSPVTRGTIQ